MIKFILIIILFFISACSSLDKNMSTDYIISFYSIDINQYHVCSIDIGQPYNKHTYAAFEDAILDEEECEAGTTQPINIVILGVERQ